MSFAERLMITRKARGLSQDDLAERIGTKGPAIGRYERGAAKPGIDVAIRIADALDVSLDYLVGKTDASLDAEAVTRVRAIAQLKPDDRDFLLRAVDGLLRDIRTRHTYAA